MNWLKQSTKLETIKNNTSIWLKPGHKIKKETIMNHLCKGHTNQTDNDIIARNDPHVCGTSGIENTVNQ